MPRFTLLLAHLRLLFRGLRETASFRSVFRIAWVSA